MQPSDIKKYLDKRRKEREESKESLFITFSGVLLLAIGGYIIFTLTALVF